MRDWSLLILVVMLPGCGQNSSNDGSVRYHIGQKGGNIVLSMAGTTITFEGIQAKGADAPTRTTGQFMASGTGNSKGQSSVDDVTLNYDYANGVAQFSLGEYKFNLIENGTKLVFGEQTFPIGTKSIRVAKDGNARSAD